MGKWRTAAITAFTLDGQISSIIDEEDQTVTVTLPWGQLTNLTPVITVSEKAVIDPASGKPQDFSSGPVDYTVTAEDGSTAPWTVTVVMVQTVTVDPPTAKVVNGKTQPFTATVTGTEDLDQTVNWTVEGGIPETTIDPTSGLLTVDANETATSLTVRATSTVDTTQYGEATVTVVTVSTVTVSPSTANVVKGGTETFSATVEGTGDPAQTVNWEVNSTAGTTIIDGVLNVASGETSGNLTVTATSTVDSTKSGTATVTLPLYTDMQQATATAVTITGNSVYYYHHSTGTIHTGVFIEGRTVTLSPFSIAKYETTYELWHTVYQWATSDDREPNKYTFANPGREGNDGEAGAAPTGDKYEPVTSINWRDAVVWCNAYSEMSGKDPVYYTDTSYNTVLRVSTDAEGIETDADKAVMKEGAKGWRLPTEAEWEYAARGGGTPSFDPPFSYSFAGTAGGTSYVELSYYAWFTFNSDTTQPVGGKYENSLGLYDMSGNVAEWCWDWAAVMVSEGTVTDPRGPATPGNFARIHRGGGYMTSAGLSPSVGQGRCSVATRDGWEPYRGKSYLGFRVVLCP